MFKVPLIASAILHATLVAAAVVGGHGAIRPPSEGETTISIEVVEAQPEIVTPAPPSPSPEAAEPAHVHSHTHDYPVPADHDRPHDPSLVHDHAPLAESAASEPSEVVALPASAAAPVFKIVVGAAVSPQAGLSAPHPAAVSVPGTAEGGEPVLEASVDVPARLIASAPPVYPPAARADEIEADVVLDLVLDGGGRVSDAKLTRSAGYGFDQSALEAIRAYRFSPAQKAGRPVRVRMHWTVQFRLR